jgi:hypothetical protein
MTDLPAETKQRVGNELYARTKELVKNKLSNGMGKGISPVKRRRYLIELFTTKFPEWRKPPYVALGIDGFIASKITGMILDGVTGKEAFALLSSPDEFHAKIREAISAVEKHPDSKDGTSGGKQHNTRKTKRKARRTRRV